MNRMIMVACALLALLAIGRAASKLTADDPHAALEHAAATMNATLPRKMNAMVTMTRVDVQGDLLRFGIDVDPALPFHPEQWDAARRAALIAPLCNDTTRRLFKHHVSAQARYHYTDAGAGAAKSYDLTMTPADCT